MTTSISALGPCFFLHSTLPFWFCSCILLCLPFFTSIKTLQKTHTGRQAGRAHSTVPIHLLCLQGLPPSQDWSPSNFSFKWEESRPWHPLSPPLLPPCLCHPTPNTQKGTEAPDGPVLTEGSGRLPLTEALLGRQACPNCCGPSRPAGRGAGHRASPQHQASPGRGRACQLKREGCYHMSAHQTSWTWAR